MKLSKYLNPNGKLSKWQAFCRCNRYFFVPRSLFFPIVEDATPHLSHMRLEVNLQKRYGNISIANLPEVPNLSNDFCPLTDQDMAALHNGQFNLSVGLPANATIGTTELSVHCRASCNVTPVVHMCSV